MEISKKDWQLFRTRLPDWQEAYMDKLIKEYVSLLNTEKNASEKFWELERLIEHDKHCPGVSVQLRKSDMIANLINFINDRVICFEDLSDFSDEIKETVRFYLGK